MDVVLEQLDVRYPDVGVAGRGRQQLHHTDGPDRAPCALTQARLLIPLGRKQQPVEIKPGAKALKVRDRFFEPFELGRFQGVPYPVGILQIAFPYDVSGVGSDSGRRDERIDHLGIPERVVIKSFTLTDGSSLPQIIRESRALEAAKQLGLVLEHDLDEHRFFYVMPYHEGDHLGLITRQMHGKSDANGLNVRQLGTVFGYVEDLLGLLAEYHRGGLWHKDVKPENIIIHDGEAHLVDLGLVTPLRSAMTLTTHGTEYFRDPEMVRMALRGVKVHQVDGAKFDIYAVGAVLYFITEGTFPAHGGLSAFSKRSPEAMRWIIRRAMADYNKRYETADQMLTDLRYISAAHDPFSVKLTRRPR